MYPNGKKISLSLFASTLVMLLFPLENLKADSKSNATSAIEIPRSIMNVVNEDGLIAYYDFDNGRGQIAYDRSPNANHAQIIDAQFVQAGKGLALQFDKKTSKVTGQKINNPRIWVRRGIVIEAWIKPSFTNDQAGNIVEFSSSSGQGVCGLTMPGPKTVGFYFRQANNKLTAPLSSGGWQHIAGVFDWFDDDLKVLNLEMKLYVNGEKVASQKSRASEVEINQGTLCIGNDFKGLIDDVRIYDHGVPEEKIFKHFVEGAKDKGLGLLLATSYSLKDKIGVDVDFRLAREEIKNGSVEVKLSREGEEKVLREGKIELLPASGKARFNLPWGDLATGNYKIQAFIIDQKGKQITEGHTTIRLPEKPKWVGSQEGITDKVLPPWTPIETTQTPDSISVSMWGRKYVFGKDPFLSQIYVKNEAILSAPVCLKARADGKDVTWAAEKPQVIKASAAEVVLSQSVSSLDKNLTVTINTTVEYDGMAKMEWKIDATRPAILEALVFEIAMPEKIARYINNAFGSGLWIDAENRNRELQPGALPKDAPVFSSFMPHIWLGDEEKGLVWICESDHNWFPLNRTIGQKITSEKGRVILRHLLVQSPVRIMPGSSSGLDLSYIFGLQATPIKPMVQDGWDDRIAVVDFHYQPYNLFTAKTKDGELVADWMASLGMRVNISDGWSISPDDGKPLKECADPLARADDFKKYVALLHSKNIKCLPYFGFHISAGIPEWDVITEEFFLVPKEGQTYWGSKHASIRVCQKGPCQDYLVDGVARLMEKYDIDGVYLDSTGYPCPCENEAHGCGYRMPDGTRRPTYPIWAVRDTLKRLYTVIKTRKPDGIIDLHTGGGAGVPILAWATSYFHPEGFGYIPRGHFALDVIPLARFRAELMGHQYGTAMDFLSYGQPYTFEEAYAFTLLHDVLIRGTDDKLIFNSKLWKLSDKFGRKEAEWLPYWKNGEYVEVEPKPKENEEGGYVSLYKHPQNGVLAVVSNLTRGEADIKVKFNLDKLGLAGSKITVQDALREESLEIENGKIKLFLPSLGWRLVWIKPVN